MIYNVIPVYLYYEFIFYNIVCFFAQVKKGSGLTSASARANADQEIDEILKVRFIDDFNINVNKNYLRVL